MLLQLLDVCMQWGKPLSLCLRFSQCLRFSMIVRSGKMHAQLNDS